MSDKRTFASAPEVRAYCKEHGFHKISVRYADNPFGGRGRYWVKLTDLPKGITLIHSSGSQTPATTYSDDKNAAERIGKLREVLDLTANASCNH